MPIDEKELRKLLRRVRHWAIDIDEAADCIRALVGGGDATTTPPDAGT